ncbi:hypothetical protein E4U39_001652 [Claviceps sp. Clav50 group G5]|nr:hypothetical protein E4U39_001652 [Claviceps sp. Clav50 group G5]
MDEEKELNRQLETLEEALRIKQNKGHIERLRMRLAEKPKTQSHDNEESFANPRVISAVMALQPAQFEVAEYDGKSYGKLKAFILDLEIMFHLVPNHYPVESMKVGYASGRLRGGMKERWVKYAGVGGRVKFQDMTWQDFVDWLYAQMDDKNTQCLDALKKLLELRQTEGQTFTKYYDQWITEKAEYPRRIDDEISICLFLNSLLPEIRDLIVSKQFPMDWNSLLSQGTSAEIILGFDDNHNPAEQPRTKRRRSQSRSPSAKKQRSGFK